MHGVGIASLSHSYRPGGESALSGGQDTGGVMDVHARTRSEPDARAHSHGMPDMMWYRMEKAVAPPPEIGAGLRGGCSLERSLV